MTDTDWEEYSKILKEGFSNCKEFLVDKFDLLEQASVSIKNSFSIDNLILFCMDKGHLRDIPLPERADFIKNVLEIYFCYSRNMLLYFDIYSEKSITENTSQMANYLSKLADFSDHLSLIGYTYRGDVREWRCLESSLTPERRAVLECMTICCCLGIGYLEKPLKFLRLSIFDNRRKSLLKAIEGSMCEYCNFELNVQAFTCSVCDQSIEKMDLFKKWELEYTATNSVIANDVTNCDVIKLTNQNESQNIITIDQWQCPSCTALNDHICVTCVVCFSARLDIDDGGHRQGGFKDIRIDDKGCEVNDGHGEEERPDRDYGRYRQGGYTDISIDDKGRGVNDSHREEERPDRDNGRYRQGGYTDISIDDKGRGVNDGPGEKERPDRDSWVCGGCSSRNYGVGKCSKCRGNGTMSGYGSDKSQESTAIQMPDNNDVPSWFSFQKVRNLAVNIWYRFFGIFFQGDSKK